MNDCEHCASTGSDDCNCCGFCKAHGLWAEAVDDCECSNKEDFAD